MKIHKCFLQNLIPSVLICFLSIHITACAQPAKSPTASTVTSSLELITPGPTTTVTPKPTATPIPTPTVTPEPTATPVPTPTVTPEPTATPVPTSTPTPEPTPSTGWIEYDDDWWDAQLGDDPGGYDDFYE